MSRTIPRAYVTAAWNKNPVVAKEDAKKYCQELVKEGYLPLCPILAFDGIFSAEDTEAHTSERPYKRPFSHEMAMEIIMEKRGTDFDPDLVNEFISIESKIKECLRTKEEMLVKQQFFRLER